MVSIDNPTGLWIACLGSRLPRLQAGLRLLLNLRRPIRRRSSEKAEPRPREQPPRATHPPESSALTTDFDLH